LRGFNEKGRYITVMRHVQLMVFDLDGTLAATGEDLAASVNYALAAQGLPCLSTDRVIGFVGDGLRELMVRALGPDEEWRLDTSLTLFAEHHDLHLLDHTALYPGVLTSLNFFRDKKKVVLTNKRWRFADKILRSLGIESYFDAVIGGDCHPYMKPDTRLIPPLLERFSTVPELTVMVGDGRNDVLLAKYTGLVSCAYLGGLTAPRTLLALDPDYVIESMSELPGLFR